MHVNSKSIEFVLENCSNALPIILIYFFFLPAAKKKRVSNFVRPSNSLSPMSSLGRSPNNRSPSAPVLPPAVPGEPSGESKTNAWLKTNQEELGRFSPSNSKSNDFTTKFVRIGNSEQRRVYKAEFNKDYNRYMVLHAQLDRVSQRFANLQRQLRHTSEASPDHQVRKNFFFVWIILSQGIWSLVENKI